jgi:sugar O-acyltransferase (sialic acid O-acetyltransferase NeuD family)
MTGSRLLLPQVSANETSATVIEWLKPEGARVRAGESVCSIETTKSLFEVEADADGHLYPLVPAGQVARVGETIAWISEQPVESVEELRSRMEEAHAPVSAGPSVAAGRSWTRKAELLARRHALDPESIPFGGDRLREADVLAFLEARKLAPSPERSTLDAQARSKRPASRPGGAARRILILGGGDGAVQVLDAVNKSPDQRGVAVLDDNPALHGSAILGVPVLGPMSREQIIPLFEGGECDAAVISISTLIPLRRRLFEELTALGIPFANVIHPTACIGESVSIGSGNVILAFCHLGPCASIGDNNFLSPYVSIEHHNQIGSHCSYGPAVIASSRVIVGDETRFGTGIFIEPKIEIGAGSTIGSGAILRADVPAGSIVKTHTTHVIRSRRE